MVCRTDFFFFVEKNLTIMFFGVKFTGDYRNVAVISTLFRDRSHNSKKTEFFIVFSNFHRDPEIIML